MMKQADIDGDSHISYIFQGYHEEVRRIIIRQRIRILIFLTYFRVAMKKLCESLSDKELEDLMKQADIDADSHISYIFQGCHEEVR